MADQEHLKAYDFSPWAHTAVPLADMGHTQESFLALSPDEQYLACLRFMAAHDPEQFRAPVTAPSFRLRDEVPRYVGK